MEVDRTERDVQCNSTMLQEYFERIQMLKGSAEAGGTRSERIGEIHEGRTSEQTERRLETLVTATL